MPVIGMFAVVTVAGLVAGVGVKIYRHAQMSANSDTYSPMINAMEGGTAE